ncbi:hypothetical protein BLAT2472_110037 [Burkholderia latens]
MSAITSAELEDGGAAWATPARERRRLAALIDDIPGAPFDVAAAPAYGPVRDATGERKRIISTSGSPRTRCRPTSRS